MSNTSGGCHVKVGSQSLLVSQHIKQCTHDSYRIYIVDREYREYRGECRNVKQHGHG